MTNINLKGFMIRKGRAATPQSLKAADGQKRNHAGGFVYVISDLERVKRFLILGSDTGFYASGAQLTKDNAKAVIRVAESAQHRELVDVIVETSVAGRAPKQDPALFALAIAASFGEVEDRAYALAQLPKVARTATALFGFLTYVQGFRGWGRALARAVAAWYTEKSVDQVAYQAVKYRQRDGWTHRDVFRKAHPRLVEPGFTGLGEWILRGDAGEAPGIVQGFEAARFASASELPGLIREHGLTWEMVPTEALNDREVWEALLEGNVPLGALIRQLPRLTRIGVLEPMSEATEMIAARLVDVEALRKARIHPLNVLVALRTYAQGHSMEGKSTWEPNPRIVDALDEAFYRSFGTVEPAGKRTLIALDVSGSMTFTRVAGVPLTPREASAGLALVLAATEPMTHVVAFTGGVQVYRPPGARRVRPVGRSGAAAALTQLAITPRMRLDAAIQEVSDLPFGPTDCSLPMLYAAERGLEVDTFVVITDNETWAGAMHPHQALAKYRAEMGIDAKLIVLATLASKFSIADPNDAGMLDISGFDAAVPALVTEFSRGL
ncbi:MAG: TROVE domain-containing protein [Actinobacteria bacterium HGW-Actinobacteria-4]|nr:MAG: TROVE domain-containing protein [Actinobacteria bacterium HGW-Actinobacteria-4]